MKAADRVRIFNECMVVAKKEVPKVLASGGLVREIIQEGNPGSKSRPSSVEGALRAGKLVIDGLSAYKRRRA